MVQNKAKSVAEYLRELPDDRRAVISKVRAMVRKYLPKGYREQISYGMITYDIPLERFPDTYNGQPLCYVSLASQKNHISLYLVGVYGNAEEKSLRDAFKKAGKKLDMGKSCVRFKKLDDLPPLDAIGEIIGSMQPEELIARHEQVHGAKKSAKKKK